MILHPAIENLIKSVNDDKEFTTERGLKSASTKRRKSTYNQWLKKGISREELSKILSDMSKPGVKELGVPELTQKKNQRYIKKGDVYPSFYHILIFY
jgi:hypothetical protein